MSSWISLAKLDPWDSQAHACNVIIETVKGERNKFKYEPETGTFVLCKVLPCGAVFPFDFGFIPATRGDDGDPLDIMVLMDAPAHVGCLIDVRIVGIIDAEQTQEGKTEKNSRILGAAIHSYEHENLKTISDVSQTLLSQVEEFFISYNKQRGKKFKVTDTGGPKKALRYLKSGIQAHRKATKK